MEAHQKSSMPIGKKLQLILLVPLVTGIVVCTIFVITIVFISQSSWLSDTKAYIKDKEEDFMLTLSQALASHMQSVLGNQWYYLYFVTMVYENTVNGNIAPAPGLTDPKRKTLQQNLNQSSYPDNTSSVWLSGNRVNMNQISEYMKITDPMIRTVQYSTGLAQQLGIILEDGEYQYVYPSANMSYAGGQFNYTGRCNRNNTAYSPVCTKAYSTMKKGGNLTALYEDNRLFILNKFSAGAGVSILPKDFLLKKLMNTSDYTLFGAEQHGNWTLFVSGAKAESFMNVSLAEALYEDVASQEDFNLEISEVLASRNGTIRASVNGEVTYFAVSGLNIEINSSVETGYIVGISSTESKILSSWSDFISDLTKTTIIQACIFAIFFILTLLTAWRLALIIAHRVIQPLKSITSYLDTNDPPLHSIQRSFNSQINSILENLRRIEVIEQFIDPAFLLSPITDVRIKNLKTAKKLFKDIENKRGCSIIYNLLGNAEYSKHRYQKAETYYRKALLSLERLLEEIITQESEEAKLTQAEKEQLKTKRDDFKEAWADEKAFVNQSICERLQQICMALTAKLKEEADALVVMRSKWKELIKLQTRILQYYESTRENYVRYLKLLLDMAEIYQILQYFHTASELLDIIEQELWKLDVDKTVEVDIDVNRLRKIGIEIIETDRNIHFQVSNITFEKDILMQKMLYRRAMLALDSDKYQKAAIDFTLALETGSYYDAAIRAECVKELYNILNKFGVISLAPDLKQIYDKYALPKKSVVFALSFDLKSHPSTCNQLVTFFSSQLSKHELKISAITKCNTSKIMELHERDFPGMDLENLIIQSKTGDDNEGLLDSIHRGIEILQTLEDIYLVVVYRKDTEHPGVGTLESLKDVFPEKLKIILVNLGEIYALDLEIFIENHDGLVLEGEDFGKETSKILDALGLPRLIKT